MRKVMKPFIGWLLALAVVTGSAQLASFANDDHEHGHDHQRNANIQQIANHDDDHEHGDHTLPTTMAAQAEEEAPVEPCSSKSAGEDKLACDGKKSFWDKLKFWKK